MKNQTANQNRNIGAWKQEREREEIKWKLNLLMYKLSEEQMESVYTWAKFIYICGKEERKQCART